MKPSGQEVAQQWLYNDSQEDDFLIGKSQEFIPELELWEEEE